MGWGVASGCLRPAALASAGQPRGAGRGGNGDLVIVLPVGITLAATLVIGMVAAPNSTGKALDLITLPGSISGFSGEHRALRDQHHPDSPPCHRGRNRGILHIRLLSAAWTGSRPWCPGSHSRGALPWGTGSPASSGPAGREGPVSRRSSFRVTSHGGPGGRAPLRSISRWPSGRLRLRVFNPPRRRPGMGGATSSSPAPPWGWRSRLADQHGVRHLRSVLRLVARATRPVRRDVLKLAETAMVAAVVLLLCLPFYARNFRALRTSAGPGCRHGGGVRQRIPRTGHVDVESRPELTLHLGTRSASGTTVSPWRSCEPTRRWAWILRIRGRRGTRIRISRVASDTYEGRTGSRLPFRSSSPPGGCSC